MKLDALTRLAAPVVFSFACWSTAGASVQFQPLGSMPTTGSSASALPALQHADVNGDGFRDLIYFNNSPSQGRICVALSNGDSLASNHVCSSMVTTDAFGGIALGDLNGDGKDDLVVGNSNADGSNVEILLGTQTGQFMHFASTTNGPGSPPGAGLGDFNGDGMLDLVGTTAGVTPQLSVRLGQGDGTFATPQVSGAASGNGGMLLTGDINADGRIDIIYLRDHSPSGLNSVNTQIRVNLGNGDGTFTNVQSISIPTTLVNARLARIDTDDRLDLMVYGYKGNQNNSTWGGVYVFTTDTGLLQQSFHVGWLDLPYPANGADVADLDGDQRADLILVRQSTSAQDVIIWPNQTAQSGSAQFDTSSSIAVAGLDYAKQVIAFNFDNSPLPDLVVHDMPTFGGNSLLVYRNTTIVSRPGDVNADGAVNVDDLLAVMNSWGACPDSCPPTCAADVTNDCTVNVNDLLVIINNWG